MTLKLRQTLGNFKEFDDEWSAYATAATLGKTTIGQAWRIDPLVQGPSTRNQLKTYKKMVATDLVGLDTFNFEAKSKSTYSASFSAAVGTRNNPNITTAISQNQKQVKIRKLGHHRSHSVCYSYQRMLFRGTLQPLLNARYTMEMLCHKNT
jgi:hypothetical protein